MIDFNKFLAQLTPEEREKHKALIEETEKRNSFISDNTEKSLSLLEKRDANLNEMKTRLNNSGEIIGGVGSSISAIHANGQLAKAKITKNNEYLSDLKLAVDLHTFDIECSHKEETEK